MKKSLLVVFLFFVFYSGFSQGTWTIKAALPAAGRQSAVAFSIGSKGYMGTGDAGSVFLDDFWEYDPVADAWTQKATFPGGPRGYAVGFSIGNKGYVGTGEDTAYKTYNDFWEYNPATNIWTQRANLPGAARATACAFAVNGFGYVGTGYSNQSLNDFWKYDPVLNSWTKLNNFPGAARSEIDRASFVIGNKAYWGLGYDGSFFYDFWEYNPATDSWTQKANFPGSARGGATGFSICNIGYLGLGCACPHLLVFNDFWKYNPANNSWSAAPSFPGYSRVDQPSFVINNRAYVGTGAGAGVKYLNDWAEYTPSLCYPLPVSQFLASDTAFCNEGGKCIDFYDHSTNDPISWQWFFPGAVPDTSTQQVPRNICYLTPGTYAVTLIVNNGNGSDTLTISPMITFATSAAPPVLTRSNDTIFCSHAAAYQWYFNGLPIPGATDSFYVATVDGLYAVQITDANGCVRLSDGFAVSVNELGNAGGIKISPNPVSNEFTVYSLQFMVDATLEIYNLLGEKVKSTPFTGNQITVHCKPLPSGIYFIKLNNIPVVLRLMKID